MGEIFLARQSGVAGFDRLVILKTLLPELAEQPGFIDQFLDEARVAATLNHPNIVSIFEVGEWGGVHVIAMEYIKGANLGQLLLTVTADDGELPVPVVVKIVRDAALGLDHAHNATDIEGKPLYIVHRDIGLQNIMVRDDGVTKVVDFGIARAANRATRTRTGLVKGKLQYMSPEQVAGQDLDARSDQFSLGVVLWEMIAKRRLFRADNDLETLKKLTSEPIPVPSSENPSSSPELDAVVMRMLERDREARYARCAEVADALKQVLESGSLGPGNDDVAACITSVLGEKIEASIKDLTPSSENPFAAWVAWATGDDQPTIELTASQLHRRTDRRRRRRLFIGVALAGTVGVLATLYGLRLAEAPETAAPMLAQVKIVGPAGAIVSIDGVPHNEPAPTLVAGVEPGIHYVRLELSGQPALYARVILEAGKVAVVDLPPPPKEMVLDIREPVGARIIIDGKRWKKKVPAQVTGLAPGPHEVRLELPSGKKITKRVRLKKGRPTIMQEPPPALGMVLDVREPLGAYVVIDGKRWRHPVPTVVTGLRPGFHEVRLLLEGRAPVTKTIELRVDEPVLIREPAPVQNPLLVIDSSPSGATVRSGDRKLGVTPVRITTLEPGVANSLVIEKEGHEPVSMTLTLQAGETREMMVPLPRSKRRARKGTRRSVVAAPPPRSPPAAPRVLQNGFLTLRTKPWTKVFIDNKPHGSTPLYRVELAPGNHTLHLENEGMNVDVKKKLVIKSGQTTKLDLSFVEK